MNKYYVYIHRRQSDNLPFYVGKGSGRRAKDFYARSNHWNSVKNKHGVVVEVLFDKLTEDEAFQVEIDTILEFKYFGYPLVNKTKGGEGISGLIHSEQTKLRLSDKTAYTFVNKQGEIFVGTRYELCKRFKLNRVTISQLFVRNDVFTSCGWTFLKENETIEDCLSKFKSRSKSKTCKNIYLFKRKSDGLLFEGTRAELCEYFNLDQNELCVLFGKRNRKHSQGWSVVNKEKYDKS